MEVHHQPPPPPTILPSTYSPRFTPIAIAPKPNTSTSNPSITLSPPPPQPTTITSSSSISTMPTTTIPSTPSPTTRELWTDAEKYDLLWSIILSTGLTASTIPWHKITLPKDHTIPSAQVVIQDIAFGKHHITHPTFTPSNKAGVVMVASRDGLLSSASANNSSSSNSSSNNNNNYKNIKDGKGNGVFRGSSKKRKLDSKEEPAEEAERKDIVFEPILHHNNHHNHRDNNTVHTEDTQSPSNSSPASPHSSSSSSSSSSPPSNTEQSQDHPAATTTTTTTTTSKPPQQRRRRQRSDSPPIELDLSNPRITSYLKAEGYMNEDGTPVKRKRGRPTKDPFGLSVTLKKQLMRMDPNAPPMKKRGRPRKRFLDVEGYTNHFGSDGSRRIVSSSSMMSGCEDDGISPGLRQAIEKIGEEMDKDVEELLDEGRSMRDTEDDDESEGYEGEVAEVWDDDETGDEEGDSKPGETEKTLQEEDKPERMLLDKKEESIPDEPLGKAEGKTDENIPIRQVEKMAVGNLVEKPRNDLVWFGS